WISLSANGLCPLEEKSQGGERNSQRRELYIRKNALGQKNLPHTGTPCNLLPFGRIDARKILSREMATASELISRFLHHFQRCILQGTGNPDLRRPSSYKRSLQLY